MRHPFSVVVLVVVDIFGDMMMFFCVAVAVEPVGSRRVDAQEEHSRLAVGAEPQPAQYESDRCRRRNERFHDAADVWLQIHYGNLGSKLLMIISNNILG